jgi:hypothetical protein
MKMVALVGAFPHILLMVIFAITLPKSFGFSSAPSPARVKDTKVAVRGKATVSIVPPSHALSHNVTLTNYMQLPVEQYVLIPMPLGSSLTRINSNVDIGIPSKASDGEEFELVVPNITFFKLTLQPVVYASVQPQKNQVVITSTKCILKGSSFIEKVKLNDRYDFNVRCALTWDDTLSPIDSVENNNQNRNRKDCSITVETTIDLDVDVPKPFSSIPKMIIEKTGNAAVKLSMKYIQGSFVDNLAKDYAKWATDVEYRNYRASLSAKEVVVEDDLLVELRETI